MSEIDNILLLRAKRIKIDRLDKDENLLSNGIVDSLTVFEIVSLIEERLKIKIPDFEINPEDFSSLNSIQNYINRLTKTVT